MQPRSCCQTQRGSARAEIVNADAVSHSPHNLNGPICGREIDGLLLDFADVELLDARVLALIESARLRLEDRGATLRVVAAGQPLRLLRLTGMAERITTLGCRARGERLRPRISGGGDAAVPPRFEAWTAPSSSSSSPTPTSGPPGVAATR